MSKHLSSFIHSLGLCIDSHPENIHFFTTKEQICCQHSSTLISSDRLLFFAKSSLGYCAFLQVYTWGHRLVTPRRVIVARNIKKSGAAPLKFHRMERLHVVSVAAGMTHSTALTEDGALFYWVSSDPDLRCQQVLVSDCYFMVLELFDQNVGQNLKQSWEKRFENKRNG